MWDVPFPPHLLPRSQRRASLCTAGVLEGAGSWVQRHWLGEQRHDGPNKQSASLRCPAWTWGRGTEDVHQVTRLLAPAQDQLSSWNLRGQEAASLGPQTAAWMSLLLPAKPRDTQLLQDRNISRCTKRAFPGGTHTGRSKRESRGRCQGERKAFGKGGLPEKAPEKGGEGVVTPAPCPAFGPAPCWHGPAGSFAPPRPGSPHPSGALLAPTAPNFLAG